MRGSAVSPPTGAALGQTRPGRQAAGTHDADGYLSRGGGRCGRGCQRIHRGDPPVADEGSMSMQRRAAAAAAGWDAPRREPGELFIAHSSGRRRTRRCRDVGSVLLRRHCADTARCLATERDATPGRRALSLWLRPIAGRSVFGSATTTAEPGRNPLAGSPGNLNSETRIFCVFGCGGVHRMWSAIRSP